MKSYQTPYFLQIHFHGPRTGSVPNDVPDSTVSGVSIFEKLQDIYIKNVLFYLHILKVEEYNIKVWGNPEYIAGNLSLVNGRINHHLVKIKTILKKLYPEIALPATPAPPQLSHDEYANKEYGWGVIVSVKAWHEQVLQVIEEMKKMCDQPAAGGGTSSVED